MTESALLEAIRSIVAREVRAAEARILARLPAQPVTAQARVPTPEDVRRMVEALIVLARGDVFWSKDVHALGQADPAFRALLVGAGCEDVVAIGYALRHVDEPVAGHVLQKVGRDEEGAIWQFVRV